MKEMADRLKDRLTELKMLQADLVRTSGISKSVASSWVKGKVKKVYPENLINVTDALRCEIRWLVLGKGPKEKTKVSEEEQYLLDIMRELDPVQSSILISFAQYLSRDGVRLLERRQNPYDRRTLPPLPSSNADG